VERWGFRAATVQCSGVVGGQGVRLLKALCNLTVPRPHVGVQGTRLCGVCAVACNNNAEENIIGEKDVRSA
jgi:hypothetical protein